MPKNPKKRKNNNKLNSFTNPLPRQASMNDRMADGFDYSAHMRLLAEIEDELEKSHVYKYDTIGIHASMYAIVKRDIASLSYAINKHILNNIDWQRKIVAFKQNGTKSNKHNKKNKINLISCGHSLGGTTAAALMFHTLLMRFRNHIPNILSPFVELTQSITFGAIQFVSLPNQKYSNMVNDQFFKLWKQLLSDGAKTNSNNNNNNNYDNEETDMETGNRTELDIDWNKLDLDNLEEEFDNIMFNASKFLTSESARISPLAKKIFIGIIQTCSLCCQ